MDIITIIGLSFFALWFGGIIVVGIVQASRQWWRGELTKPKANNEDLAVKVDDANTTKDDPFTDSYKNKANKEIAKDMYTKEDNESEITKAPRKNNPIYIAIILCLSVLLVIEYTDQTNEVFITSEEAEKVITECWDERLTYCKEEGLADECTFGTMNYCQAKYPKHNEIFTSKYGE